VRGGGAWVGVRVGLGVRVAFVALWGGGGGGPWGGGSGVFGWFWGGLGFRVGVKMLLCFFLPFCIRLLPLSVSQAGSNPVISFPKNSYASSFSLLQAFLIKGFLRLDLFRPPFF